MRLHRPARRLARVVAAGGVVKMVTIARDGHQWWASFNVRIAVPAAARPTRRQQDAGMVGVDLGVAVIAATSEPVITANGNARGLPAHCQSAGWRGARDQVARLSGLVAQRRASSQHLLTKQLVTQFAHVALEDLRVKNMTRSARGTQDAPGRNVAAKAGLNRAILDVGFGEIRRQIEYKAEHGTASRSPRSTPPTPRRRATGAGTSTARAGAPAPSSSARGADMPPTPTSAPPTTSNTAHSTPRPTRKGASQGGREPDRARLS